MVPMHTTHLAHSEGESLDSGRAENTQKGGR